MTTWIIGLFLLFALLHLITKRYGIFLAAFGLLTILSTKSYTLLSDFDNRLIVLLLFLPLGLLAFYLSLVLSNLNFKAIGSYFPPKRAFWDYVIIDRLSTFRFLSGSLYEELLWRGTPLFILDNAYIGLLLSSFLFTVTHLNKRKELFLAEILDIFIFAIFQGVLLILFRNIYLLILTHSIRNLLIYYWFLYKSTTIPSTSSFIYS